MKALMAGNNNWQEGLNSLEEILKTADKSSEDYKQARQKLVFYVGHHEILKAREKAAEILGFGTIRQFRHQHPIYTGLILTGAIAYTYCLAIHPYLDVIKEYLN